MLKAGLTGNIGSGKTLVSGILSILGVPVYHADKESKKFLDDPAVMDEVIRFFGKDLLGSDGKIDRRALAGKVFNDPDSLKILNGILHPRVLLDFRHWSALYRSAPYLVMEAAIIFESGIEKEFDTIIHISCPKEIAVGRVIRRDRTDGNAVLQRMQFQMEDEEKSKLAGFVIVNDGSRLVIPQVLSIHRQLLEIGAQCDNDITPGSADA